MKKQKKPAAIFDMDKTLLDSDMKLKTDVAQAMSRLGANIKPKEVQGDWYKLANSYGLNEDEFDKELDKRKSWKDSIRDGEAPLFKDVLPCLEELYKNNIKLGLLTRSTKDYTSTKIHEHGLEKYFNGNIEISPVGNNTEKHNEASKLIEKLNPEEISKAYFIGDKLEDVNISPYIQSSYKLSSEGILINRKNEELTEEAKNYKSLNSLEKIPEIIKDGR